MAALPILIVLLTVLFRRRSEEDRYLLLLVLSISLVFQYSSFYLLSDFSVMSRLPLQLCNFACFVLPFAIVFKRRSLLCFASTANVLGAIVAVVICDSAGNMGLFYPLTIHFIAEHTGIIVISILSLTLDMITPLRKRDVLHVLKYFTLYFLFVLVFGTILNALYEKHNCELAVISQNPLVEVNYKCNFLFMFHEENVTSVLPSMKWMFDISLPIGKYAKLILAQPVIYLVFSAVCVATFYILYAIFGRRKQNCGIFPDQK